MNAVVEEEAVAEGKLEQLRPEQRASHPSNNDLSDNTAITNWGYFILFSYLYLLQGIVSGIIGTTPYIYAQLPDYNTMALFGANLLPFSFKFVLAPFLQKYFVLGYGKRKTWMVIGCLLGGISLTAASFVTEQKYANLIAILYIVAQTGMALLDIAAHAVMIKQLKSKSQTSVIISYSQLAGILIGGLILLKLTSAEFARSVGRSHPITTPQLLILVFGLMLVLPVLYLHFRFAETALESERKTDKFSFCQIICYYRVCLRWDSRYFRTCIFFLFSLQGFNFFSCLYDYELVRKGFSKDTMNTLANILVVPIVVVTFFFGSWTNLLKGRLNSIILTLSVMLAFDVYLLIFFPLDLWTVAATSFITSVFQSWRFYLYSYMINDFPVHGLSGMFITFMASFSNFGRQHSIHTWLCGIFTWKTCAMLGLALQLLLIILLPWFYNWVQAADSTVPKEIQEESQQKEQVQGNQLQFGEGS